MKTNRKSEETIVQHVDETLDKLDQMRQDNLQQLRTSQDAKSRSLEREKKRLAQRLGENHPRVKALSNRVTMQAERLVVVDEEIVKSQIQIPEIDKQTWMVHGRVLDIKRQPLKGLTIGLGDEKGQWIKELGYTCTDEKGYFNLKYKFSSEDEEVVKARLNQTTATTTGAAFLKQAVYILVTDQAQKVLHRDTQALYPEPNRMIFREIILKDQVACTPPPGGTAQSIVDPDVWKVFGRIKDEKGQAVSGVTVSVYDKDLIFDDKLGETKTNAKGEFEFQYRTEKFRDVIEAAPDIYLKVLDAEGNLLYTTKKAFRFSAGHAEAFDIKIPRGQTSNTTESETEDGDASKNAKKKSSREIKIRKDTYPQAE